MALPNSGSSDNKFGNSSLASKTATGGTLSRPAASSLSSKSTVSGVFKSTAAATAARPAVLSSSSTLKSPYAGSIKSTAASDRASSALASLRARTASAARPLSSTSAARPLSSTAAASTPASAARANAPAASRLSSLSSARSTPAATASRPLSSAARPASSLSSLSSRVQPSASALSSQRTSTASAVSSAAARPSASGLSRPSAASRPLSSAARPLSSSVSSRPAVSNDDIAKKLQAAKQTMDASRAAQRTGSTITRVGRIGADGNKVLINENQEVTDVQYRRFAQFIEQKSGIVLGDGKQYLVNSRLTSLLGKFRISTVDELINRAMEEKPNNKIQDEVIDAMTTNETLWFRDTYPYTALDTMILPELAKRGKPVRIWSAACSSGQEPYSIAMVVQEQMGKMLHVDPKTTQIIGTDLSPEMLAHCKKGWYDVHALSRGLSAERKSKFFVKTPQPNMMAIEPKVKKMVEFRPMNLLGSYALMGRFDVIFCRNVLIYFSNDVKAEILKKLTMCLNPGGYLILGSTETLVGVANQYDMLRCNPGIIYKYKATRLAFDENLK